MTPRELHPRTEVAHWEGKLAHRWLAEPDWKVRDLLSGITSEEYQLRRVHYDQRQYHMPVSELDRLYQPIDELKKGNGLPASGYTSSERSGGSAD